MVCTRMKSAQEKVFATVQLVSAIALMAMRVKVADVPAAQISARDMEHAFPTAK